MAPTRLIYASTRRDRSAETLDAIFEVSRSNNQRDDINGALIVSDGSFVQILEGDRGAVSRCMVRIVQDVRHTDIEFVTINLVPHRLFSEWSLHQIEIATVKKKILQPFLVDGAFQPKLMSQAAIEELCRVLNKEETLRRT